MDSERELILKAQNGDSDAKTIIIKKYENLIHKIIEHYKIYGMEKKDLFEEGVYGILKAIEKFDLNKDIKFITYAYWWIKKSVLGSFNNYKRTIRIPSYLYDKYRKYNKAYVMLKAKYNREPKLEEICDQLKITIEELKELLLVEKMCIGLNIKIFLYNDSDLELKDVVSINQYNPELLIMGNNFISDMRNLLDKAPLNDREKDILKYRMGFINNRIYTCEEIGKIYNLTKSRISKIELKALEKIRNDINTKYLEMYLDNNFIIEK